MSKLRLFSLARTFLIKHRPFYAAIIADCVINLDWDKNPVDSAIKNGRVHLFINQKYLEENNVPPRELALVIEQEINCLLNKHQIRAVNHEQGRYIMAAHIATGQLCFENKMPEWSQRMNLDQATEQFKDFPKKDMPAEIYYEKIPPNPPQSGYGGGSGSGGGNEDPNDQQPGDSKKPPIQHGAAWNQTNTNEEQLDSILRDVVGDAVKKSRGDIPGNIKQLIDKILKPPEIPWEEELKDFIQSKITSNTEGSWKRRNRNYVHAPHIVKGKTPKFTSLFVMFVDTSGSVSDKNLESFIPEMNGIHCIGNTAIVTVCIDHNFQSINEYDGEQKFEFAGRGGTHFDPVIRLLNGDTDVLPDELREKWETLIGDVEIDGAIYFTDGECYITEKHCSVPMIWVITSDGTKPEGFPGKVVQIKDKATR